MAKLTPAEFADKWQRRIKAAQSDISSGVDATTEAPTKKAAAKKEKMRANINAALDSGKWERGLNRVTLDEWKDKMKTLGVSRIAAGADASGMKVQSFAEELLPFIEARQKEITSMPDVTLEDNIQRMTAFIRGMSEFKRK